MVEKIGSQFSENTCLGLKRFGVYYSKCKREKIVGVGCDGIQTERSSDQLPPIKWLVVEIIMTGTMLMIMIDDHNTTMMMMMTMAMVRPQLGEVSLMVPLAARCHSWG